MVKGRFRPPPAPRVILMHKLTSLIPLLASAALLMFGNGLQGTLIAWRASS